MDSKEKAERLRFKLYGFPSDWFGITFNDTGLSVPEAQRLAEAFKVHRKGAVCYVHGSSAPIVNQYINQGLTVRGVDASLYISDPFDKEEKKSMPLADVVVLYNIYESTTQINLVQKVIKKLVNSFSSDTMIILNGDINVRAFSKDYYHVNNSCTLPKKVEEKWL